jgi:uncharacterized cofD-like protein
MQPMRANQELLPIADIEHQQEYQQSEFLILRGLSAALRQQLQDKSTQTHIRLWTPRDADERFVSEEAIRQREAGGDVFYPLITPSSGISELAGIVWVKHKNLTPHSRFDTTFAIRLYERYEGRGLATGFLQSCLRDYSYLHPSSQHFWLEVQAGNQRAKELYTKLGFHSVPPLTGYKGEIMTKIQNAKNPKIVVIGGGTGSFTVLSGLKKYTDNITAVVNMSDDGGSTGILRDELGVLPPGDIRRCLVALSDHEVLRDVLEHRFTNGSLKGHSLGNLLLSGLEQMTGDFEHAVATVSQILAIKGRVVPVTTDNSHLKARRASGEVLSGEETIGHMNFGTERPDIWLAPKSTITKAAAEAIAAADIVVIAPGNLYGSLAPALVIDGMKQALLTTKAKRVYVSNLVTKPDQTTGFMVHDFASEIERFIGASVLDYVLFNTDEPPRTLLNKYTHDGEYVLEFDLDEMANHHYKAIGLPLVAKDPVTHQTSDRLKGRRTLIRHDEMRLAEEIIKLLSRT